MEMDIPGQNIALQRVVETPNESYAIPNIELVEYVLETSFGEPLSVYKPATSEMGKVAIVTFHDIGTNHESMLSFFDYPEMRVLGDRFTVYHICAPGHQYPRQTVATGSSSMQAASVYNIADDARSQIYRESVAETPTWPPTKPYPTMDELAELVNLVATHFNLTYFVGFGVGAGANVLARYALKYPKGPILGLFLVNANDTTHGYYQWFRLKWWELPQLSQQGVYSEFLLDALSDHWFGWNQCEDGDLMERYETHLRTICAASVAGYILSYINRTNLGLIRDLVPLTKETMANFNVDCCLVTGARSVYLVNAVYDMSSRIDPQKAYSIIIPDASGMVMQENPKELALNLLHFLRNIGLVITMTPQKLKRKVSQHHEDSTERSASLPSGETAETTFVHFQSECAL